jgi:RNA polymerase sigma-70 factor (ECF subfamily)
MSHDATMLLQRAKDGDEHAAELLLPIIYDQLRALAGSYFRDQPVGHTLQPTALVHEAFVKLINSPTDGFNSRAHFMAVASTAMRQILTDHARRKRADKRGGGAGKIELDAAEGFIKGKEIDIVDLDEALTQLRAFDDRKHRVVELRFFGGLEMQQIADFLGVSLSTVEADWRAARAWLAVRVNAMQGRPAAGPARTSD